MKKYLKYLLMIIVLFSLVSCKKDNNNEVVDSLFETGYSDVTIDKTTHKATSGTVYGFYKDAAFTQVVDLNNIDCDKIYVKMLKGSGTVEDPYLIGSGNSLNSLTHLGETINSYAKVTNDFTCTSVYTDIYQQTIFNGTFDGDNHHIYLDETSVSNTGLFYKTGENALIKNIHLHGHVEAINASTGAIVNNNYGTINNCRTYGTTLHATNGYNNGVSLMTQWDENNEFVVVDHGTVGKLSTLNKGGAGGISGTNYGTITNCVNKMNVRATIGAGGMAGINYGLIKNCYNTGAIGTTGNNSVNSTTIRDHTFDFSYLGGMAGANFGTINQCVNSNQIFVARLPWKFDDAPAGQSDYIDRIRVGGIAGYNEGEYDEVTNKYVKGIITECANYGRVHGDMQVGGIAGYTSGYIADCEVISPIGARSCLGGIAGWMSGDKEGDRIAIVINCLAITRVAAGSAQSVVDEAGNQYTAVKLDQLSSSQSTSNINEYYHIAKYATNCVFHNYGGTSRPIDPTTFEQDALSITTKATMDNINVYNTVAYKNGVNSELWADYLSDPTTNKDVTAICGFNTSWQAYINEYLKFQEKTITYVVDGVSKTIKGVAGINYIDTVVSKQSGTYVGGISSNYSTAITDRALPLSPITLGANQKLIWVTVENDAFSVWDGLLTDNITIYAMAVER